MSKFIKFYFTYSMLNMFRILIHPSSGEPATFLLYHHIVCVFLFRCVLEFRCDWLECSACHTDTTPNSHTETPTHVETRTHNQCGDAIENSQAPDDGCINVRNMLNTEKVK